MSAVVHDTEHYSLLLVDTPRVTDNGTTMHYAIFCKYTNVIEAYAQMLPQGIDIVQDLDRSLRDIFRTLEDESVIKRIH